MLIHSIAAIEWAALKVTPKLQCIDTLSLDYILSRRYIIHVDGCFYMGVPVVYLWAYLWCHER